MPKASKSCRTHEEHEPGLQCLDNANPKHSRPPGVSRSRGEGFFNLGPLWDLLINPKV